MNIDRIILIGFRATGKTAVGKELAKRIGYRCIDTDHALQKKLGCSISEYIRMHGWESFRRHEALLLIELANCSDLIVATGGGAVLNRKAFTALAENSLIVWLKATQDTIRKRMAHDSKSCGQRPSLTDSGTLEEISTLLAEREPLYRQLAHAELQTDRLAISELAEHIVLILKNNTEPQDVKQWQAIPSAPCFG